MALKQGMSSEGINSFISGDGTYTMSILTGLENNSRARRSSTRFELPSHPCRQAPR